MTTLHGYGAPYVFTLTAGEWRLYFRGELIGASYSREAIEAVARRHERRSQIRIHGAEEAPRT